MKIDYQKYLKKNLINVFVDVLKDIELNGIQGGSQLYITFNTQHDRVKIPHFLKDKYPQEMTIVIQYEYWNFKVKKKSFSVCLSFNNSKVDLDIAFDSVKSFADPYANFGLKLIDTANIAYKKNKKSIKKNDKGLSKNIDNVLQFKKN